MTSPNPFTPPGSKLEDRPNLAPGSPWTALAAGAIVDIVATIVGGAVLSIMFAMALAGSGVSTEEFSTQMLRQSGWTAFSLLATAIGAASSALGGYVCARIAKRNEARLGWILAGISTLLGLVFAGNESAFILDQVVVGALLTVIGVLVGTRIGTARNRRDAALASQQVQEA